MTLNKNMKNLILLMLLFISGILNAQNYYVSPTGNDNNDGLTELTAWKSSSKVNSFTFPLNSKLYINDILIGGISFDSLDGLSLITKYGDTAIIQTTSNTENGIYIFNKGDIEINGVGVRGTGNIVKDQEGNGIYFYSDDNKRHKNITVRNCTVKHFSGTGITTNFIWLNYDQVRAYKGGYDNITFDRCIADSNGYAGIASYGIWPKKNNTNVRITNCETHYNKGIPLREPHSGHGIVAAGFVGGLIENCKASWNGWQHSTGNIGIWVHDCDQAIIQYCESWRTKSASHIDGGGFDLDGGTTNSVIQFCYSHENDGEGYLVWPYSYGDLPNDMVNVMRNNTIRYNISVNDAQKNSYGSISIGGAMKQYDLYVYNNTFINPVKSGVITNVTNWNGNPPNNEPRVEGLVIKNNLFISNNPTYMYGEIKNNVFVTDSLLLLPGSVRPDGTNVRIKSIVMDSKFYTNDPNVWNKALELAGLPTTDFYGRPMYLQRDIGATELQLDNPLPVKLLYFKGDVKNKKVILTWKSSVELNLDRYVVEKSIDLNNWKTVGQPVKPHGVDREYKFEDIDLVLGTSSYRLKAIDKDDSFEYSKPIIIKWTDGPFNIYIYDITGKFLRLERNVNNVDQFRINYRNTPGIYIFVIEDKFFKRRSEKILVTR